MTQLEKQSMYKLLREIKKIAFDASLTGGFRKGAPTLVTTYNKCLKTLTDKGDTTAEALFSPLPETATVDEVGVAAALLASYIAPQEKGRGLSDHDRAAFYHDHCCQDHEDEDEDQD
jgi:hypothetical protein